MTGVPHNRLTFDNAEVEAVSETIRSGQWACGPIVRDLEGKIASLAGVKHAVCVGSGLAALRLSLLGLGVGPAARVLVPAYSCVALANAVLACGAIPEPVDVREQDWNISPAACKAMLHEARPCAIIAVNTFGEPAPVEELSDLGVPVIEDCAHGFGLEIDGRRLGGRSRVAIISFYATKLIGAGEGGAVLSDAKEVAGFVRTWRDYGDQPPSATRLNDNMTDLEAALAQCQLDRLEDSIGNRRRLAGRYGEVLSAEARRHKAFRLPDLQAQRIWYRYCVELTRTPGDRIVEAMQASGVCAECPVTDWRLGSAPKSPVADRAYRHLVSLPLYPTLTVEEQDRVVETFLRCVREFDNV